MSYQTQAYDEVAHQQPPMHYQQDPTYPVILDDHGQPVVPPTSHHYQLGAASQFYEDATLPPTPPLKVVIREVFSPFPKRFVASSLAGLLLTLTNILLFVYLLAFVINSSVTAFEFNSVFGVFVLIITTLISGVCLVWGAVFMRMLVECFLSVYAMRDKKNI